MNIRLAINIACVCMIMSSNGLTANSDRTIDGIIDQHLSSYELNITNRLVSIRAIQSEESAFSKESIEYQGELAGLQLEGEALLRDLDQGAKAFQEVSTISGLRIRCAEFESKWQILADKIAGDLGIRCGNELTDRLAAGNRERAPVTGSVSGVIVAAGSETPIAGVYIAAYDQSWTLAGSDYSSATGEYLINNLGGGYYTLKADTAPITGNYIAEYYSNSYRPNGNRWVKITGGVLETINFDLTPGGSISGTVFDNLGAPLDKIMIIAFNYQGYAMMQMETQADGVYHFEKLAPGDYYLMSSDMHNPRRYPMIFYPSGTSDSMHTRITITGTESKTANDFYLKPDVSIFGYVTDQETLTPIVSANVQIFDETGAGFASVLTGADGKFEIKPMAPGNYTLRISAEDQGYITEYYRDQTEWMHKTYFNLPSDQTTLGPINIELAKGVGSISGRVIDDISGTGAADISVGIHNSYGTSIDYVTTDAGGSYLIENLTPGTYFVKCNLPSGKELFYSSGMSLQNADPVPIAAYQAVSGIDFHIELSCTTSISGMIRDELGTPYPGTFILLEEAHAKFLYSTSSMAGGTYQLPDIVPGDYYVSCQPNHSGLGIQWYGGASRKSQSSPIHVDCTGPVTGIDFVLNSNSAQVQGRTSEPGSEFGAVSIMMFYDENWDYVIGQYSFNGFHITSLPAGNYHVQAISADHHHLDAYYSGKTSRSTADLLTANAGDVLTGIVFYQPKASAVFGKISASETGQPIDRPVDVVTMNSVGTEINRTEAVPFGHYMAKVPENVQSYLHFESPSCIDEFYGDSAGMEGAQPITLEANQQKVDGNIVLTMNPVWMQLPEFSLAAGDNLNVGLWLSNDGSTRPIDLYMGFLFGSSIYMLVPTATGWTFTDSIVPLSFDMPEHFVFGPLWVLEFPLPASPQMSNIQVTWFGIAMNRSAGTIWGDVYLEDMLFGARH